MFTEITKAISAKEYDSAQNALLPLSKSDDAKTAATADYLIGYINTCYDNPQKNPGMARRYLRYNLNSDFPQPFAYVLYAGIEIDKNVALNYLDQGIERFPNVPDIYVEMLRLSPDKEGIVRKIKDSGLTDASLLGRVVNHLISSNQWDQISQYVFRIQNNNNSLQKNENMYLDLIKAYSYLFRENVDYSKACTLLESVISRDIDNSLAYTHYLGMIYALIKIGDLSKATEYFDRLPITNALCDFDDGPQPLGIYFNLEKVYQSIFSAITNAFAQDAPRKLKANVLYVLYLYHSSEIFDNYRYKKSDATTLARYLKQDFNAKVTVALYNMRCHFKQYKEAYDTYWLFLKEYHDPEKHFIDLSDILDNVSGDVLSAIADATEKYAQEWDFNSKKYMSCVFPDLIKRLHKDKQYIKVRALADLVSKKEILESECAFECAYAYADIESDRATELYEAIVKNEPRNSSAINNLGVRYEHKGELYKSLDCYEKAVALDPTVKIHQNNLKRIQGLINKETEKEIYDITEFLSIDGFEAIGYNIALCKRIMSINDKDMRDILFRDLREYAIAVVTSQDKMATIMCGSIIEAVLMLKIKEHGLTHYDISAINGKKGANNSPISNMGLNELLFVADKEKILDTNSYHLGHYIRDYRNFVHPAKEIRMKEDIRHDNVLTMWAVLIRIINELFI